jgi:glycerol uptake facilitator-like aquaporin
MQLARRLLAEALGTAFLLAVVVGSGIMAERLSGGNVAIALLANAVATGAGLLALILTFATVSGAHFNPVVSMAMWLRREMTARDAAAYALAQTIGAILGVAAAHGMFDLPLFSISHHQRIGLSQAWSECVATYGLILVIIGSARFSKSSTPGAVAAYIMSAYWFTASTSFANPAVAIARELTDTFAGIAPDGVPAFIAAELLGSLAAVLSARLLLPAHLERLEIGGGVGKRGSA